MNNGCLNIVSRRKMKERKLKRVSKLVLIRGLPGSGKSTMAKKQFPNHVHLEADMFHVNKDGAYKFDHNLIRDSHEWCQKTAEIFLNNGMDVVVSNTFTRLWEMEDYIPLAKHVRIFEAKGNFGSIHGVPKEVVDRMRENWETLTVDWY